MVIKRFVSILLALTLFVGTIVSTQGVSAFKADAYYSSSDFFGIDTVVNWVEQLAIDYPNNDYSVARSVLDAFGENDYCYTLCLDAAGTGYWVMTVWVTPDNWMYWCRTGLAFYYHASNSTNRRSQYIRFGFDGLGWFSTDGIYSSSYYSVTSPSTFGRSAYCMDNQAVQSTNYTVYCSEDVYSQDGQSIVCAANLIESTTPPRPPLKYFDLVYFKLGDRSYITTSDQDVIRSTNPETTGYDFYFGILYEDDSDTLGLVDYSKLTVIKGAEYWISDHLENVSPLGVYALDITDWKPWLSVVYAEVYGDWYGDTILFYSCSNTPFSLSEDPADYPSAETEAWNEFNTYITNYNTTQVVPQNLGEKLFGLTGSQTAACWVSLPDDLVVTGTTSPLLDTIQWGFNDLDPAIDFSLMDVLVFPAGAAEALVEYYYNKSFSPSMVAVDRFAFTNLLNMYDVIIIVDSEYSSGSLNPFYVQEVGGLLHRAFTGLSQGGMDYIDAAVSPWPEDQTYHGFCFITKKAIQKQQLFNFNDGIRKTYDLMVQYIDARQSWDNSFLLWSSSVFYELNSLGGRLDKIYNWLVDLKLSDYFSSVLDKLDNLVNNTSVDEVQPDSWYESLWRFINRFDVQDSTFSNWIHDLDDFYDDLPDLPELEPTIIPFPTYIPEPTAGAA